MKRAMTGKKGVIISVLVCMILLFTAMQLQITNAAAKATKITLNQKSASLEVGKTTTLKVKSVAPKKASKAVRWSSSNSKIATVSSKGVVKAVAEGTATITAKAKNGKAKASCKVKVTKKSSSGKTLVVYFSATNNTKGVAEKIASAENADLFEIEPAQPYTSADLNYNNDNSRANKEMNDPAARPAIKKKIDNFSDYDVIYMGYPIWWGTAPRIMDTFVESYDFSGKTVIPFCTSGSTGISTSIRDLKNLINGTPTWKDGRRFDAGVSQSTINDWVKGL